MKEIKEFLELQKTIKQLFKNVSLSLLDKTYIIKNHSEILAKAERFIMFLKKMVLYLINQTFTALAQVVIWIIFYC